MDLLDIGGAPVVEKLISEERRLDSEDCLLQGSYVGFDLLGAGPLLMITVTCIGRRPLGEEELRVSHRLTRRETPAGPLAQGPSNPEIAKEFFISQATARHHTAGSSGSTRGEVAAVLPGSHKRVAGPKRAS